MNANVNGTLQLLESIKKTDTVFVSVGSSAEYGLAARARKALSEDLDTEPTSPYGVSKRCQGEFIKLYRQAFNLKAVHVRPFAVIGPGKKGDAMTDFAKGIVNIERGIQKELTVGDLTTTRDFIDVRDAVCAMTLIAKKDSPDIVNICLGKGTTLSTILDLLISHAKTKIPVKMNKIPRRPMDDTVLVGDPTRLFSLGFKPSIILEQSIKDILEYWRNTI
jgi:GDP-4-dehydro-6-deoxy-D-mannose reductase